MLSRRSNRKGGIFSVRRFVSHRQEDNWRASNFLELATALFHGNAETKFSVLHRKMIIRVIMTMSAGFSIIGWCNRRAGPDNCFAVAGMDLRDIQSGKVA
ncbi:hypothetical protein [Rhizobium vallis]|uniref:hypothetical protein n=1 Tax=Rhizobium vallis TaxID=634290 RepID=UPI000F88A814|nr:hypothetical protein [Rhizobium vallis]